MRYFLFFFIIFSCSVFAAGQPAKVVSVIPVKFNSKGLHAPLPYNQQMMQRGWASVPSIAVPLSGGSPRYQPVRIAKPNLIRSLSKLAHRFANMSPAGKALLAAYGAYEANCTSQLFTSMCFDKAIENPQTDFTDFKPAKSQTVTTCNASYWGESLGTFSGANFSECVSSAAPAISAKIQLPPKTQTIEKAGGFGTVTINRTFTPLTCTATASCSVGFRIDVHVSETSCGEQNGTLVCVPIPDRTYTEYDSGVVKGTGDQPGYVCPPEGHLSYTNGPILLDGVQSCFKPAKNLDVSAVDEAWLSEQLAKNPNPFNNSDIGLDDFVDWETGAPDPDLFDNPTFDPVSPTFADAAESIATGTVQHTNPNGPNYIPSEMMPNLLIQINNWHEGNTFTDVFTGQTITPEAPPKEETPIDWSKFPGITKAQYEASNNAWGNQAVQGQNIQTEVDKLTQEQQKLTDFIETPLPSFSDQPKLLDFVSLPTSGGCKGFTLSVSLQGQPKSITVDQHCPPYNDWGQPVVSWLLSIYTLLLCFRIFHRTLEVS